MIDDTAIVEYVKCFPTKTPTLGYKKHTDKYVILASMLADCYSETKKLRRCSKELASTYRVSYRRLEEYAKATRQINTRLKQGYGKLIEITIYVKYDSAQKESWNRHYEIRIKLVIPIAIDISTLLYNDPETWLDIAIPYFGESAFIWNMIHAGAEVGYKEGIRLLMCFEEDHWCNHVCRRPLEDNIFVKIVEYNKGWRTQYYVNENWNTIKHRIYYNWYKWL